MLASAPKKHRLMLLGFGTVAQGLVEILHSKRQELLDKHNFDFDIVSVVTRSRGTMYHSGGIPTTLLSDLAKTNDPFTRYREDWDTGTAIRNSEANVVIELTHTNIDSGEPAISYCTAALESGKHVVSGNKGPAALANSALQNLARKNGVRFLNEATVMSGTPVFSLVKHALAGNQILKIRGILNGATNYILSEMEAGVSFEKAVDTAEKLGYLEADHTADLEGYDALAKVVILANALMGASLKPSNVERQGISKIGATEIQSAKEAGKRWKLIASIESDANGLRASVKPELLDLNDPLAKAMGTTNSITFTTDLLGEVTISGPGAGRTETGYAVLSDLLTINAGD